VVTRPAANRQDEFEQVALVHTRGLLRFAGRLTGSSVTAEDLVQEALLQAWRSFHQFEKGTNARAWLFRIVVNIWFGWVRRIKPVLVMPSHPQPDVQGAIEIGEALDRLPSEQQTVIVLTVVEGFTCREASKILDLPIGTVMSRLSRGRQALKQILGAREAVAAGGEQKTS
jgi:RNA polymerase sigma-70 factor, ECF subfamily